MRFRLSTCVVALCSLIYAAPAAAVTFDESVSGDVDTATAAVDSLGQPTRTLIPLDAGVNTFTGSLLAPSDTSDFIPFEVTAGMTVTSMSVALNNTQFLLSGPIIDLSDLFGNNYYSGPLANMSTPLNLGPGWYGLLLGNGLAGTGYVVTFNATAVPEPATWALLIGGLGLTGAALRRRRVAAIA